MKGHPYRVATKVDHSSRTGWRLPFRPSLLPVLPLLVASSGCRLDASKNAKNKPVASAATIVGTVVDSAGRPLSGRTVAIGDQRTTTNERGSFTLSGIAPVYDLTVIEPDASTVSVYQGLSRRDPELHISVPERAPDQFEHTAVLKGTMSGGAAYPLGGREDALIDFIAPQVYLQTHAGPDYGPSTLRWDGPRAITGRLLVTRAIREPGDGDPTTQRVSFWFSDQPVTLRAGETATVDVLLKRVGTAHQVGTVAVPDGYPVTEIDDYYRLTHGIAGGTWLSLFGEARRGPIVSFDFEVPDLSGLGGTRCVHAIGGHTTYLGATACDVPVGAAVSLTLQPPPRLSTPADGDVGLPSTQFSWTRFDNGVYELWLFPEKASRKSPEIYVHTVQTTATWPDLRPFGIAFPEATTDYHCKISGRGPFASIDEMVAPHGPTASPNTVERHSSSGPITLRISPKPDTNPASLYDETEKECGVPRGKIVVCSEAGVASSLVPERQTEWYVLSAMNIKMRHYPEFAAAIGMRCVHNCAEARAFMKAYQEYAHQHPGFDTNQPADPRPDFPPPIADSGAPPFYP